MLTEQQIKELFKLLGLLSETERKRILLQGVVLTRSVRCLEDSYVLEDALVTREKVRSPDAELE